jgi:hypothetical protein
LEITDHVIDPNNDDILIMEVKSLPFQKTDEVKLPRVKSYISFYIIFEIV